MSLKLYTAPAFKPLTVDEVKTHLRITDSAEDTYLGALIDAATQDCEHRTGRALMRQTWELLLDQFPTSIKLAKCPVLAVVSVEYKDSDGDYVTLSSEDYTVESSAEPGWIVPAYGLTWPTPRLEINAVRVRFRAGYSDSTSGGDNGAAAQQAAVPAAIKAWLKLAVGDMYLRREASTDKPTVRHDFSDRLLDAFRLWGV